MATNKTKTLKGKSDASYASLVWEFPLRPIRSEKELDRAIAVINFLVDRDRLSAAEADYLDVLGDLVERYELRAHPIEDVSDRAMLRFLIDQKGIKQVEVARATGMAESTVSEVLSGKIELTRAQTGKLADYFNISPALFMPATSNGRNNRHAAKGR